MSWIPDRKHTATIIVGVPRGARSGFKKCKQIESMASKIHRIAMIMPANVQMRIGTLVNVRIPFNA